MWCGELGTGAEPWNDRSLLPENGSCVLTKLTSSETTRSESESPRLRLSTISKVVQIHNAIGLIDCRMHCAVPVLQRHHLHLAVLPMCLHTSLAIVVY